MTLVINLFQNKLSLGGLDLHDSKPAFPKLWVAKVILAGHKKL